jgi:hypothetical protein
LLLLLLWFIVATGCYLPIIMQLSWLTSNCRPHGIFIPCSAMALWTIANLFRLIVARSQAVMGRKVSLKYYTLYQGEGEPAKAAQLSQHVENLFEAPPLFYVVCIILYQLRGGVTPTTISLAWLYVACRMVHTVVHTTTNNVIQRMYAYTASTVTLAVLWGMAVVKLLKQK